MERNIFIYLLLILISINAYSASANNKKLVRINHSIKTIKAQLSRESQLQHQSQKELKATEMKAYGVQRKLRKTEKKFKLQVSHLVDIQQQIAKYRQTISKQTQIVEREVRAAYMAQQPPLLKLLLGRSDTKTIARMRMYYSYLAQTKAETITKLYLNIDQLRIYETKNKKQTRLLRHLRSEQLQQSAKLNALKRFRHQITRRINARILTKHQRLEALLYNKRVFEKTLRQLQKAALSIKMSNFYKQKSKLHWPTKGTIINKFGTKIYQSELRWNGIIILAPDNQDIHAIADGKVVFANWLPGYGLLLIINHGKGFMSLYGRNHSISKPVGSFVHKNDVVASVGKSGGYETSSLYFAIRHNAKPLNPAKWCR